MAKKQKSESRKLAELVAKQRGIKVKSAQNWLYRVSSGKVKKPKFDLTDYAKKKVRKFVKTKQAAKTATVKERLGIRLKPELVRTEPYYSFKGSERITVPITGVFDFYGTRQKVRTIRFELFGDEANAFLNAPDPDAAISALMRSSGGGFLANGSVEIQSFRLAGVEKGPEFWGE